MAPPVVVNTSPLIAMSRIGNLMLLERMYGRLLVPEAVAAEFGENLDKFSGLTVVPVTKQPPLELKARLGRGEREAISLAYEMPDALLIIDDLEARRAARKLGVSIIGTAGVLLAARQIGLVSSLSDSLERLSAAGFRIAPRVIEAVLHEAGELP